MTRTDGVAHGDDRREVTSAAELALAGKLFRPPPRPDLIARERLLDALDEAVRRRVTLVSAPAGYGKTTLLAQWVDRPRRSATVWLSLDSNDDDPSRFWAHVAVALERAGYPPATRNAWESGSAERGGTSAGRTLFPALVATLAAARDGIVLVLDDFQCIQHTACHEQVQHLIANLPPEAHLVLVTRSDPGLRLGRLRVSGDLAEFRASDLCFTRSETTALFARLGIVLSDDSITRLMDRTEGWPAALYLATLSMKGMTDPEEFVGHFGGGDRFVGDYLVEEVISRQTDRVREFLVTAACLDPFSASLCDHVAGTDDATTILRELERSNLFVVPLDDDHQWFRFHHLFAAVARSELELRDPTAVPALQSRAAEWFIAHGDAERAITSLLGAGQYEDAARAIQASWLTYVDAGREATVRGWLDALPPTTLEADPNARVTAAWMCGLAGDVAAMDRHLSALSPSSEVGPLPDGTRSVGSAVHLIRGAFAYAGPLDAIEAADRAAELETDRRTASHALAHLALGQSRYLLGDLHRCMDALSEVLVNEDVPAVVELHSLSLRSLAHDELGDVLPARELAEHAMELAETRGLRGSPAATLALTAFGLSQLAAGNVEEALLTLEGNLDPRWQPRAHVGWPSTIHLLATARVAALSGRVTMARALTDAVVRRVAGYSDGMEAMHVRMAEVQSLLRADSAAQVIEEPLTNRERDVLRLLQSDLTPVEIADTLYLTSNTVKTHARAIYRKLGVHSRDQAVVAARRRALL